MVKPHREMFTGVALAMSLSLLVFLLNFPIKGPMIQADEGSYLANAAAVAGYPNDLASSYHAGYSMLIAPAFLAGNTPRIVWLNVKILNAALYFLIVLGLWLLAKHINTTLDTRCKVVAVVAASLYPMWVVMAGYSFSQIAFVPVFIFVTLLLIKSVTVGIAAWLGLGIITGFLYWIHPTAGPTLIAVVMAMGYLAWRQSRYGHFIFLLLTIFIMVLIYQKGIVPCLHDRMTISGLSPSLHYPGISKLFLPLYSWAGLKNVIARMGGHIFYLSVGSVGLIWVGLLSLMTAAFKTSIIKKENSNSGLADQVLAIFLLFAFIGTLVLSVLFFSVCFFDKQAGQRLDHWMYGRYVEGVIAPILLVGVLSPSLRRVLIGILVASLGAALLATDLGNNYMHTAPFNASAFWQDFFLKKEGLWAWLVAGCALVGLVASLPRQLGLLIALMVFAFDNYLQIRWHIDASNNASKRWMAAAVVREQFPVGSCVGFDHSGINSYHRSVFWLDYGFQLFDYSLMRINFERWYNDNDCVWPLFSYSKDLDKYGFKVYPLIANPDGGPVLWVKDRQQFLDYLERLIINIGKLISFAKTENTYQYLSMGWSAPEPWGTWSDGDAAMIVMKLASEPAQDLVLALDGHAFVTAKHPHQEIDLKVNGHPLGTIHYDFPSSDEIRTVPIPKAFIADRLVKLEFGFKDAISPKELGLSQDPRRLGLGLVSLVLQEEEAFSKRPPSK